MATHAVGGLRLLTVALAQHLILQSARQGDHAFLLGILGEILLALSLQHLVLSGGGSALLLLLSLEEILYYLLGLTVVDGELTPGDDVLDGLCKIINVQFLGTHIAQLTADAETQCITYFIHLSLLIL